MNSTFRREIRWRNVLVLAVTLMATPVMADHYTVTVEQSGFEVTATGSGRINLDGLTFWTSTLPTGPLVVDINAVFATGGIERTDIYIGPITSPLSFTTNISTFTSSSGDLVGIVGSFPYLQVPFGYASEAMLSSSGFSDGIVFRRGLIAGDYVWSWGGGCATDQCFELDVEQPPPGSPIVAGPGPVLGSALPGAAFALLMAGLWARRTR